MIRAKILLTLIFRENIVGSHWTHNKNKQMFEEDNFDEDDVVIYKVFGGSWVEEKRSDDEITFD